MDAKEYQKILDQIAQLWTVGSTDLLNSQGIPKHLSDPMDRERPERGYPVVLEFKPSITVCDWCGDINKDQKTYIRNMDSQVWKGRCEIETCKMKKQIPNSVLVKNMAKRD
jgi:uncharacterized C2H2 Zn-finger protein